jgi:phage shock protein C
METLMNCCSGVDGRRLYRDADRAVLGGVCAGLSTYLGINLKVTRFLCIIAFLCAFPFALIAYFIAVLVIPVSSSRRARDGTRYDELRKQALREEILRAKPTVKDVRERYKSMDERLARIEKYVTSRRYELDEEFRRL